MKTARNQRHILDSDLYSLQAQQRQTLDPNNERLHLAAGLPSSDHEGILVCARCYRRYFISVLSSDHEGILVCARCYRRYFISVLSSDHEGILVCARCYSSYFISVLSSDHEGILVCARCYSSYFISVLSSDHEGILVCARCYSSYFISVLSSDHEGILVCARCYSSYFISVLSSDHGGVLVCARCYRSYFISVLAQRACHQVAKFNEQLRGALQFYHFCPKQFKPHSFPIGPATTAAAQGMSESQIRSLGRRSSDAFMKYIRCSQRVSALSRALACAVIRARSKGGA